MHWVTIQWWWLTTTSLNIIFFKLVWYFWHLLLFSFWSTDLLHLAACKFNFSPAHPLQTSRFLLILLLSAIVKLWTLLNGCTALYIHSSPCHQWCTCSWSWGTSLWGLLPPRTWMTPLWTGAGLKTLEGEWLLVWEGHQSPKGKMGGGTEGKYHALDCFSDYNVTLKQNSSGLAQRPGTRLAKKGVVLYWLFSTL